MYWQFLLYSQLLNIVVLTTFVYMDKLKGMPTYLFFYI